MLVVFQGGESADHVATVASVRELDGGDVPITMSASWRGLSRRSKGAEHIAAMAPLVNPVLEGGYSGASLEGREAKVLEDQYYEFAFSAPELVFAVQFDHPALGQRPVSDPRVVPLLQDNSKLKQILELNGAVAMPVTDDPKVSVHLRRNPQALLLALGAADLKAANKAGFNVVMTSAWYAPGRFGEISLWDGNSFHRRNSTEREHLLRLYGHYLQSCGHDIDALLDGDSRELNRLAVWSYLRWASTFPDPFQDLADSSAESTLESAEDPPNVPDRIEVRSESASVTGRPVDGAIRMLPGFVRDVSEEAPDQPLLASSGVSLRQCDNCFLADTCPSHSAGSSCAYGFPVEVRTPVQVKALLSTMVEIQAGRVAFAKFAEDVHGGYPEETVGVEMDRLFKMADQLTRPTKKERLTVSVESESSGGGTGVLSAIFGKRPPPVLQVDPPQTSPLLSGQVIEPVPGRTD